MQLLIAFSGKMGSGKSTAIDTLKASGLGAVYLVKFAQYLYSLQAYFYKMIEPVYTPPPGFVKNRKFLQEVGSVGRELDEALWVKLWAHRVNVVRDKDPSVIIVADDCRYDNEAEMVRSLGGVIIQITRKDSVAHAEGGEGIKSHASEAGIRPDLIDYTITNDGTLEEFKESLGELFKQITAARKVAS